MSSEEQTIHTPSEDAAAKARQLGMYIAVDVSCVEPTNKEPKRNAGNNGYWQTMANLRVKISNKQSGILLFSEFNALMGCFKPDDRAEVIIINCDNSMTTNNGRTFAKTRMSDELHALVYVAAMEAYSQKGFIALSQQSEVAQLTGRSPSEIISLTKACIMKAQTYGSIPTATPVTRSNVNQTIAQGADADTEDSLPLQ